MTLKNRIKIFFLILLIFSIIIQGYSVYAYSMVRNRELSRIWCYRATPLDYISEDCWNLTDPDPYILEAIQNPGEWTETFRRQDSLFWSIAPWYAHLNTSAWVDGKRPKPFIYNGTCYNYDVTYAGTILTVNPLDETPEEYWNLTTPDKDLLKAMKNPGKPIHCVETEAIAILSPYLFPSTYKPFHYNGTYYSFSVGYIDVEIPLPRPPQPEHTAMALAGMWVTVGSVYILRNRKTKTKP